MANLTEQHEALAAESKWDFSDLSALFINCTLKRSPEVSNTRGLADLAIAIMERNGVSVEVVRAVDHQIATGVYPDMTEHGWDRDDWPAIFEKVMVADILVVLSPIGRWRHPRAREPEEPVGGRVPLRLRQPRLPLRGTEAANHAAFVGCDVRARMKPLRTTERDWRVAAQLEWRWEAADQRRVPFRRTKRWSATGKQGHDLLVTPAPSGCRRSTSPLFPLLVVVASFGLIFVVTAATRLLLHRSISRRRDRLRRRVVAAHDGRRHRRRAPGRMRPKVSRERPCAGSRSERHS